MVEFLEAIRDFTETGGQVLLVIGFLIFVMWLLILERVLYILIWHKEIKNDVLSQWQEREDKTSWNAEQIRQAAISRMVMALNGSIPIIQALRCLMSFIGFDGNSHWHD